MRKHCKSSRSLSRRGILAEEYNKITPSAFYKMTASVPGSHEPRGTSTVSPVAPRGLIPAVERTCPVCNTGDHSRLFAEANLDASRLDDFAFASRKLPEYMHLRLLECRNCDILYASPMFSAGTLAAAYHEAAYDSDAVAKQAAKTYSRHLEALLPQLGNRNGAIDIGAGNGAFLHYLLEAGFENVVGIEPSASAMAAASPDVKPHLRTGLFNPADFTKESISLITCFQTIEHVDDPLRLCRDAFELLRPGGAVLLIAHNRRAFSARLLGRKSPIFDLEHLQLFSRKSLGRLLDAAGFQNVRVSTVVNRYPISYWSRLFPMPAGMKSAAIRALDATGVGRIQLPLPAGNIAAIGFRR